MGSGGPATKYFLCPPQVRIDTADQMIRTMQNTSAIKEVTNGGKNMNGLGRSTRRLTTHPRYDESDEFVTQDYHRVCLDDLGVLHARFKGATTGIGRGESR